MFKTNIFKITQVLLLNVVFCSLRLNKSVTSYSWQDMSGDECNRFCPHSSWIYRRCESLLSTGLLSVQSFISMSLSDCRGSLALQGYTLTYDLPRSWNLRLGIFSRLVSSEPLSSLEIRLFVSSNSWSTWTLGWICGASIGRFNTGDFLSWMNFSISLALFW